MVRFSQCAAALAVAAAALGFIIRPTISFAEDRSFDGAGNNLDHPDWGAAGSPFVRQAAADYGDGISTPRLAGRPNPRLVGNIALDQTVDRPSARRLSGFVYAFGQFLSHDLQHTVSGDSEPIRFRIPAGDPFFVPGGEFPMTRSLFDPATGTGPDNPRQQVNFTSSFLDGSQIYGADEETALIVRGGPVNPAKLRTSSNINGDGQNMLPHNAFGPAPDADYVAGDNRVNDSMPLTALHTLFMREHNRLVDELAAVHREWSIDELYQRARKIVGAELQAITYREFLPALLGTDAISSAGHYNPAVQPAVMNEFATVFLRIGHSMLPDQFQRTENDGHAAADGPLPLEQAFANPAAIATTHDLDLFLKGFSVEVQQETDLQLVDGMRLALLDAIDIQRARDHGLAGYNDMCEAFGLARAASFADITSSDAAQQSLATAYANVDSVEAFVGVLAEGLLPGASVGPLAAAAFREQFTRLRDGDRFWFESDPAFAPDEVAWIAQTRLADVISRNTAVSGLQDNVFFAAAPEPTSLALRVFATICAMVRDRRRRESASRDRAQARGVRGRPRQGAG